jgi:hypothetical protein
MCIKCFYKMMQKVSDEHDEQLKIFNSLDIPVFLLELSLHKFSKLQYKLHTIIFKYFFLNKINKFNIVKHQLYDMYSKRLSELMEDELPEKEIIEFGDDMKNLHTHTEMMYKVLKNPDYANDIITCEEYYEHLQIYEKYIECEYESDIEYEEEFEIITDDEIEDDKITCEFCNSCINKSYHKKHLLTNKCISAKYGYT